MGTEKLKGDENLEKYTIELNRDLVARIEELSVWHKVPVPILIRRFVEAGYFEYMKFLESQGLVTREVKKG